MPSYRRNANEHIRVDEPKAGRVMLALYALVGGMAAYGQGRVSRVEHFEAPPYPPLARQAMISGHVSLDVGIDADGLLIAASEDKLAHPLLAQEAKACIRQWKFNSDTKERKAIVVFYYGFSGTTAERNPKTTVKADFTGSSTRVFITTDPPPAALP
jgi:hypothetical protein